MFTDMVGYTALGQKNEALSLAMVEEQRKLIRPILSKHGGREVKTIGDAFLVEFPNAVGAVRCGYDIQRSIREFNLSLAPDKRIHLRIGVHLGEVIESQGDIVGDAVNVASRIEPLAEDGGVCLSRQVYDQVKNKVDFNLPSLGPKSLKNVGEPIEVYKIALPWEREEEGPSKRFESTRIAVLPFINMSPNHEDEYFADGLTEELISTMSKISGLRVIARTSVMGFKGEKKKISEVARELEVGTVLEGSVRKVENRLRITVQLINSETSDHLWAESYDREMKDIFAIQSEISQVVADALRVRLLPNEKSRVERKPTENVEAYETYLRGLETAPWIKGYRREDIERTREFFERAVELDHNFALAYAGLEQCYMEAFMYRPFHERLPKAEAAAERALEIDDDLAESHLARADVLWHDFDRQGYEKEITRAIELKPNSAQAHMFLGVHYMLHQRFEEAEKELRRARELDPLAPVLKEWVGTLLVRSRQYRQALEYFTEMLKQRETADLHDTLASIHLFQGDYAVALIESETAVNQADTNERPFFETTLACIYARSDKKEDALKILKRLGDASNKQYIPRRLFSSIYSALGDRAKALQTLWKAYEEHDDLLPFTVTSPMWDDFRSEPEFTELLSKLGIRKLDAT
jgi:TolB-like protein/Flp pilus assembly protein TadD